MTLNVSSYKTIWTASLLTVKILVVTLLFFIAYSTNHLCACCIGDVFYDARNDFLTPEWEDSPSDSDDSCHVQIIRESSSFTDPSYTPPPCSGPYKRRKIIKFDDGSSMSEESYSEIVT